jgi:hypothetical protein
MSIVGREGLMWSDEIENTKWARKMAELECQDAGACSGSDRVLGY